ncbi:unnamed protein product, partial [Sphacelaria rigidula]
TARRGPCNPASACRGLFRSYPYRPPPRLRSPFSALLSTFAPFSLVSSLLSTRASARRPTARSSSSSTCARPAVPASAGPLFASPSGVTYCTPSSSRSRSWSNRAAKTAGVNS